jgi:putative membrane protein
MDRSFMEQVSQGNLAEVHLGKLALQKSKDSGIKPVAQQIVNDHTVAQQQLQNLARSLSVTLPTGPNASQTATYNNLSAMSGSQFDKAYVGDRSRRTRRRSTSSRRR